MKIKKQLLHLIVVLCLVGGWIAYLPTGSPNVALADTPLPPDEAVQHFAPPTPPAQTQAEDELRTALEALEIAQQQGPGAVLALGQTLHGEALDLAMDDIVKAHRQLAQQAPPRPPTPPVSEAEELVTLQAQVELDAAGRARALAYHADPAENQAPIRKPQAPTAPNAPTADLTVGSAPCTHATLAAAIAAANPGDRLLIEGGVTFTENINVNKNLTLVGGYNGCGSGSLDRTTIDGGGSGRVAIIDAGLSVTLTNLNLTGGSSVGEGGGIRFALGSGGGLLNLDHVDIYTNTAVWGGGLWVGPDGQVVGTYVDIYNNTADTFGGGVRLYGSQATFSDSDIYNNTATLGAGVYGTLEDGFAPLLNLPSYADVYNNDALTGDGFGGGVYMREGTANLADCSDIYQNDAIEGGGAYLVTSTLTLHGNCSEIASNTATGNGGGVRAQGSTINLGQDAELYNNTAGTDGSGNGGGAYLNDSDLWGDKGLIYYNTADDYGGGVYAANNSVLDMDLGGYACTGPRCSQLSYNTATSLYGGGAYANDSEIDLRQIFVEGNSASAGGGIYAYQGPVYLFNDLVAYNDATGSTGDGIRLFTDSSLDGAHNTLAYNDAGGAATGRAIDMSNATLSLENTIIWGHTTSSINNATQTVACSDIQGGYVGVDNLDVDPLFVNPAPAMANFHLQHSSPVIDRCATGQTRDFEDENRPMPYFRPATPYDIGADEASARVGINGAPCAYGRIQDAVDAAASGDTLQATSDTFVETVNITDKDLAIVGGYDVDCTTAITGMTTVDGNSADSVFEITNGVITLRNLNITGGDAFTGGGVSVLPGGSQVTLDNTDVFGNQANYGGGLYVDIGNVLTFTHDSDIHHNTATSGGGGARVWGQLFGYDNYSDIYNNSAPNGGAFSVPGGILYLNNADVYQNQATAVDGRGGGIYVDQRGVVTLTNSAYVYFLNQAYNGGGVYADDASVYLEGTNVIFRQNIATNDGGAIYLSNHSALYSTGSRIGQAGSSLANEAVHGAGIYAITSTVNFRGRIINNIASSGGAGIYADNSTLNLNNAQVGGTGAYEANQLGANGHAGAGLYLSGGTHAVISNTIVTSNTFQTSGYTYGGGLYVNENSVVTLTNSNIERHYLPSMGDGRGAGIYVYSSTVTLDNSAVLSNTAGTAGGGVRAYENATLNIVNGSEFHNNHALTEEGGAIAGSSGALDINISDSTLQNNTAGTDGGAVYLDAGALDFGGQWDVRWNSAGGNGGAVAVEGTGAAAFIADDGESLLAVNTASGDGGALYVDNASTLRLHAADGYPINLNSNNAGGDGGAAYADNGAYFDVYGQVIATSNIAGGNGGAFYLGNGSRLWLNDYTNIGPRLQVNRAQNGGAIYAQDSLRVECDGAVFGSDINGNSATSGSGGALYLSGSVFDADNCTFRNSQATQDGGAIAAYTSTLDIHATYPSILASPATERQLLAPQAIQAAACNPLTGECSSFYGNTADSDDNSSGDGGALYVNNSTLVINHTYLHRNSAVRGGAVYQTGVNASAQISNSLIYSNTVSIAFGAGIRRTNGAFTVTHVTLANNIGGAGFSGVASAVFNTIAWNNEIGGFATTPVISSCTIDQSGDAGVSVDPLFAAPGAGENYHLLGGSPAIDACAVGEALDLDNITRPVDAGYDMGAYEYARSLAFAPDNTGSGSSPAVVIYTHTLTNTGGAADVYTLTAYSSNGWSVALDPAAPVPLPAGQSTPVTASLSIPAGVVSGTLDTLVITATSGATPTLTAVVTDTTAVILPLYTLTVNVAGNGAVAADPDQPAYLAGTVVTLTATPDPGWYFGQWSGDASGALTTTTVVMTADRVVTATFSNTPSTYYTLTMGMVGSGVITPSVGAHSHLSGTTVDLSASPAAGWQFSAWTGDLESSANPTTLTMDADKDVTATFTANTYTITPTAGVGGTITPATPQPVSHGDDITFTITAGTGYHILDVGVDGVSQGALSSYAFTGVTADHTLTATFALSEYTLTVDVVGDGAVTQTPSQTTYLHGDGVTLIATPGAGSYFWQWTGDASGILTTTTVTMDADKLVTATFSTTPPAYVTLTLHLVGNGIITPSVGAHARISGTTVDLSASPAAGWQFDGWTGDLESSANPAQIVMDADKDVTATFTSVSHALYLPLIMRE